MLSQVVLSLQLSFAVIPLVHLVSDRRWMGQYVIRPITRFGAWLVAGVIAVLNIKLATAEVTGWLSSAGSWSWLLWISVVPAVTGLTALLAYVAISPILQRRRGDPVPSELTVHGPIDVPVLTPPRSPRRIAVAVDFTAADAAVLSHAVAQAQAAGRHAEVVLLHVVESGGSRLMGQDHRDHESQSDQQRLERYATELAERKVEARYDLGFGGVVEQLVELIGRHRPDLVIVGGHGHGPIGDFVHGTIIGRLRHRVQVPVLVVPSRAAFDHTRAGSTHE